MVGCCPALGVGGSILRRVGRNRTLGARSFMGARLISAYHSAPLPTGPRYPLLSRRFRAAPRAPARGGVRLLRHAPRRPVRDVHRGERRPLFLITYPSTAHCLC